MTRPTLADITAPPPPGTTCECEVECDCFDLDACPHEPSHWHQRLMGASCDTCQITVIERDVLVYTRAHGYEAIARLARDAGWDVTADGVYTCPACRAGLPARSVQFATTDDPAEFTTVTFTPSTED